MLEQWPELDGRNIKHKSINDVGPRKPTAPSIVACIKALPAPFRTSAKYREKLSFAKTINHLEIRPG